nr:hypothetical protein [Tanacetum cinerariifolium]
GGQLNAAPVLEVENFTNWKKRFMCHIIGIEPQYENIISNGPFIPMAAAQKKPEAQWTADDFQDSLDDEEDTRSCREFLNDLEEEYQARALLSKSKRFFKKGKNKGLIAKTYDWDDEEMSSNENEVTEVNALMAPTDEERVLVGKESARNGDCTKSSLKKKKKILRINQLTEDTSSFRSKDSIFIKSFSDNSDMSITSSNIPKSSETEDSTLPNQDTDEVPSNESQRNITDLFVVVSDS